jgi:hypothetical protein
MPRVVNHFLYGWRSRLTSTRSKYLEGASSRWMTAARRTLVDPVEQFRARRWWARAAWQQVNSSGGAPTNCDAR